MKQSWWRSLSDSRRKTHFNIVAFIINMLLVRNKTNNPEMRSHISTLNLNCSFIKSNLFGKCCRKSSDVSLPGGGEQTELVSVLRCSELSCAWCVLKHKLASAAWRPRDKQEQSRQRMLLNMWALFMEPAMNSASSQSNETFDSAVFLFKSGLYSSLYSLLLWFCFIRAATNMIRNRLDEFNFSLSQTSWCYRSEAAPSLIFITLSEMITKRNKAVKSEKDDACWDTWLSLVIIYSLQAERTNQWCCWCSSPLGRSEPSSSQTIDRNNVVSTTDTVIVLTDIVIAI